MRHAPARRKAYSLANALADAEIASELYSTAGDFDLLVKFYLFFDYEGSDDLAGAAREQLRYRTKVALL
jgi:hypothetical protein